MKVSSKWLRKYLDINLSDDELANIFTFIGLEVEDVIKFGLQPQGTLIVGEIVDIAQHPNADKLSVCKVQIGQSKDDVKTIVCGAKNFKLHDHVPVALSGTILPGGVKINVNNLRGVHSEGMMCSARELGFGNDHAGLMILQPNTTLGEPIHKVLGIVENTVFDLSLTANRGDCLSHIGVARDVASKLNIPLKLPDFGELKISNEHPNGHFLSQISVETANCECYTAICIKNVKIGESPSWMQEDLAAVGIRSINNIVDIGNWVMMETGQPVHIFDAKKIHGQKLIIRQARDGERVISLDGKERVLDSDMMVICDAERPLVIAGITGSIDAEVDATTTDVLIESAYFNPENIRKTAHRLNISTESSYRFSRDIDTSNVAKYGQRVADLMVQICGGEIASDGWQIGKPSRQSGMITFNPGLIEHLCGFKIPLEKCLTFLRNLGFSVDSSQGDSWKVEVPAHRPDITCAQDIVTECLRIYGTDTIPSVRTSSFGTHRNSDKAFVFCKKASDYLSNQRFLECYNLSLKNSSEIKALFGDKPVLMVNNPLTVDQDCYRNSLIPGLLETVRFNIQNGNSDQKFFEIGHVVVEINGKFNECMSVALVIVNDALTKSWHPLPHQEYFDVKAIISPILQNFISKVPDFELIDESCIWEGGHAGNCGHLNREKIEAQCGHLSRKILRHYNIQHDVLAAEVLLHLSLFDRKSAKETYKSFSQFPRITKDLSLLVKREESAASVEKNVFKAAKKCLPQDVFVEATNIFDIYTGTGIPEDKKNVGISILYRSNKRTLTDEEIQNAFSNTQNELQKIYEIRKQG